jgi:Ca2+-binding RTX toxin-like protein
MSIVVGIPNNNFLSSTDSKDQIFSSGSNDIIIGGEGNDVLTGGFGADNFTYNNAKEGFDIIKERLQLCSG